MLFDCPARASNSVEIDDEHNVKAQSFGLRPRHGDGLLQLQRAFAELGVFVVHLAVLSFTMCYVAALIAT